MLLLLYKENGWLAVGEITPLAQDLWEKYGSKTCLDLGFGFPDNKKKRFDTNERKFYKKRNYRILSFEEAIDEQGMKSIMF